MSCFDPTHQHHLIRYSDGPKELYDFDKDPHQYVNLAKRSANAKIITELSEQWPEFELLDYVRARTPRSRRGILQRNQNVCWRKNFQSGRR